MKTSEVKQSRDLSMEEENVLIVKGVRNCFLKRGVFIISRMRDIIPEKLITTIIQKSNEGTWSYSQITKRYGLDTGIDVTKQAIWKATQKYVFSTLQIILSALLGSTIKTKKICANKFFKRIIIEDSSSIKIANKFKSFFPGSANQNGSNSCIKFHTIYDLVAEQFIDFKITPFTDNDLSMSKGIFQFIKTNDLIIRDMGYFIIDNFKEINNKLAFFISRLKFPIKVFYLNEKEISFFELLKTREIIDIPILLGIPKLKVRLIAIPIPKKEEEQRRRKANLNKRINYTDLYKFLLGWNLMITNIAVNDASPEEIYKLYTLRWRIESIFKMWKSYMNFADFSNVASLEQLLITIVAKLIWVTLIHQTAIQIFVNKIEKEKNREVSLFQLYNLINEDIKRYVSAILNHKKRVFYEKLIIKTCLYEKRNDRQNYTQLKNKILALF